MYWRISTRCPERSLLWMCCIHKWRVHSIFYYLVSNKFLAMLYIFYSSECDICFANCVYSVWCDICFANCIYSLYCDICSSNCVYSLYYPIDTILSLDLFIEPTYSWNQYPISFVLEVESYSWNYFYCLVFQFLIYKKSL